MKITSSLERSVQGSSTSARLAAPNPDVSAPAPKDTYSPGKESAKDPKPILGPRGRFAVATVAGGIPVAGLLPNLILLSNLEDLDRTNAPGHLASVVGIAANFASFGCFAMGSTLAGLGFAALSSGTTAFAYHSYRKQN